MEIIKTNFPGLLIIIPTIYRDTRGYFFESYNKDTFKKYGMNYKFVQDNQSKSYYGVIRGLHYQLEPYAQTKLIRVLEGKIYDVVVDLRKNSPTYGQNFNIELSAENNKQLLVPRGFAHGFSVLSKSTVVFYKCDNFYNPHAERGIIYNDKKLNIDWKIDIKKAIISDKDKNYPDFDNAEKNFVFKL